MTLGFIGTGHITAAMVEGLAASGFSEPILLSPRNAETAKALAGRFANVRVASDNQAVADGSQTVVLAVRPPVAREVTQALTFRANHVVLSLVALRPEAEMRPLISPATVFARAVPLPSTARRIGPIAYFPEVPAITALLRRLGTPILAPDEATFHRLWSLTGLISPIYALTEAFASWAAEGGVPRKIADDYVRELMHCLAVMGREAAPETLARAAATPGGINEQCLRLIRENGGYAPFRAGLAAVFERMTKDQG